MAHFAQGFSYVAGFDKPALISVGTIRSHVEAAGFAVRGVWPCSSFPGLPFAVPGVCGDQWDYVAMVTRTGPSQWIEVPSRVHWLVAVPPPQLPPTQPAQPGQVPPPPQPTQITLVQQRETNTLAVVADKVSLGVQLAGVAASPLLWSAASKLPGRRRHLAHGMVALATVANLAALAKRALDP